MSVIDTLRFYVAVLAPLLVLGVGALAARRPLPADRLTRTMLGGCVRLAGPIGGAIKGARPRGVTTDLPGRAGVATVTILARLVGWLLVVGVVVGLSTWLADQYGRAVILAWVGAVVVAGLWGPGQARVKGHELGQPERHLKALRHVLASKAQRETDGTPWALGGFKLTTSGAGDVTVTYKLPMGIVASDVTKLRDQFVAALRIEGVPSARWVVDMDHEVDRLAVTIKAEALVLAEHTPTLPTTTRWSDPVRVGRDERDGSPVHAPTHDVPGWLVGGQPGFGKSVATRLLVAHYAADPAALLWGVDGKDDEGDWGPIRPRFARWVEHDPDERVTAARYLTMLRDARAEMVARNVAKKQAGRHTLPGMLVLIEEATELRSDLGKDEQAEADRLIRSLMAKGRAVNMLILQTAQKPSAKQMDTDVRSLAPVALCFHMRSESDARMVLGDPVPEGMTELDKGHAVLRTPREAAGTPVLVDHLTDDAWRAFCEALPATAPADTDSPVTVPDERLADLRGQRMGKSWVDFTPAGEPSLNAEAPDDDAPEDAQDVEPTRAEAPDGQVWFQLSADEPVGAVPALLVLALQAVQITGEGHPMNCTALLPKMRSLAAQGGALDPADLPTTPELLGAALNGYQVDRKKRTLLGWIADKADPANPTLVSRQLAWVTKEDLEMAIRQNLDSSLLRAG